MENPNAKGSNNMIVGLFVLVALVVSFGFITFIGKTSIFSSEVTLKAFFKDARGLNVGAPVYMSGIQVGRVSAKEFPEGKYLELAPKGYQAILLNITLSGKYLKHVKIDSEATITTVGMLGDKVIVIAPGAENEAPLKDNDLIRVKEEKELSEYFAKGGSLVENLNNTAQQLHLLISQLQASGKITTVMANLEKVTSKMAEGVDDFGPAMKSLKNVLAKVEKGDGTLGSLVNDSSLHEDLRVLLGGAQRSATVRFLIRQAISNSEKKGREPGTNPEDTKK